MSELVFELRRIRTGDSVDVFTCGDPGTDRFLRYHALPAQTPRGLTSTWVALATGTRTAPVVAGFLTTSTASLDRARFPDAALMRRLPGYPLPVLRVSRLGVANGFQRRGLGAALLRHAETLAALVAAPGGVVVAGLVVDAPTSGMAFLEKRGFARLGGRILEGALHGGPAPYFRALPASAPAAKA